MDDVRVIKRFCDADQGAAMSDALEKDEVRPPGGRGGCGQLAAAALLQTAPGTAPLNRRVVTPPARTPPSPLGCRRRVGTRSA
jgi:hypothetical protein